METVVWISMSVSINKVSARRQARARTPMVASDVSAPEDSSSMTAALSVLIRTSVRETKDVKKSVRILKAHTSVAVQRASSCTCTSTSASTPTNVRLLQTRVEPHPAQTP